MTQSENENDHFDLDHFDHTCKELKECMEYKECKTDVSNDKTIVLYYLSNLGADLRSLLSLSEKLLVLLKLN